MQYLWMLMDDPRTDSILIRVYRWMLQWPESVAFPTMLDPAEICRATGLSADEVECALAELVDRQGLRIEFERPDGVKWVVLSYAGPNPSTHAPLDRPKVPREQKREISLGLRWKILERDGRKCRACGATVEDGAKLVIDHIKPYSKGGLTTEANLQTLCYECNAGKFNKWLELA